MGRVLSIGNMMVINMNKIDLSWKDIIDKSIMYTPLYQLYQCYQHEIINDSTEAKKLEDKLLEIVSLGKDKYKHNELLSNGELHISIDLFSLGKITYINNNAAKFLGYNPYELSGASI